MWYLALYLRCAQYHFQSFSQYIMALELHVFNSNTQHPISPVVTCIIESLRAESMSKVLQLKWRCRARPRRGKLLFQRLLLCRGTGLGRSQDAALGFGLIMGGGGGGAARDFALV